MKGFDFKIHPKAGRFLFGTLHIIFIFAAALLVYGIAFSAREPDIYLLNCRHAGVIYLEYLMLSLCECVIGAFVIDRALSADESK